MGRAWSLRFRLLVGQVVVSRHRVCRNRRGDRTCAVPISGRAARYSTERRLPSLGADIRRASRAASSCGSSPDPDRARSSWTLRGQPVGDGGGGGQSPVGRSEAGYLDHRGWSRRIERHRQGPVGRVAGQPPAGDPGPRRSGPLSRGCGARPAEWRHRHHWAVDVHRGCDDDPRPDDLRSRHRDRRPSRPPPRPGS